MAIASITSCTNTSNPSVMVAAALLAKNAVERGLSVKPWVKTSLAPGSKVVMDYYAKAGLVPYLEKLGFHLVGYGCTTCIGNSGPLPEEVSAAVQENDLAVVSVLSGNRNFEGRINPDIKMNYLASPPLVIAYALAGTMDWDPQTEPIGVDESGADGVPRRHLARRRRRGPRGRGVDHAGHVHQRLRRRLRRRRALALAAHPRGRHLRLGPTSRPTSASPRTSRAWRASRRRSTDVTGARVLAKLGDSVTTDHISPAGSIKPDSPAGVYLAEHGVDRKDFNSYGSRRGNHEVMIRGTFANIRLRNQLLDGVAGRLHPRLHPRRRADDDLRRGAELRRGGHPAGGAGRQGVRLGLRRATGRPRAPRCSASGPSSPSPTSGSTART